MAPHRRRSERLLRIEDCRRQDEDDSAEESEEDEEDDEEEFQRPHQVVRASAPQPHERIRISLKTSAITCKVCGKRGHQAGFVGAKYVDCPNKPCYLCKQPGHTTATCPHRVGQSEGSTGERQQGSSKHSLFRSLLDAEVSHHKVPLPPSSFRVPHWHLEAAIVKLHPRRVTSLAFHPTKLDVVVSGDKKGNLAAWNFEQVHDKTVYNLHSCIANNLCFLPNTSEYICSAAADGTCKVLDLETSCSDTLVDLNPDGWIPGVTTPKTWGMLHGMDVSAKTGAIAAGDNFGKVYFLDRRANKPTNTMQCHKYGTKVVSVNFNPADPNLLMSAGNDYHARLWDVRSMSGSQQPVKGRPLCGGEVGHLEHPRVINSAYFSPVTGTKILTTCQDNRLRVYDSAAVASCGPPSLTVVHSHDFNRYLTPFRAQWCKQDLQECTLLIGRYISEDFSGTALHPVDIIDACSGKIVRQLTDVNLTTISPVNAWHPTRDIIVSGSSGSLFLWKPRPEEDDELEEDNTVSLYNTPSEFDGFVLYDGFEPDEAKKIRKKQRRS